CVKARLGTKRLKERMLVGNVKNPNVARSAERFFLCLAFRFALLAANPLRPSSSLLVSVAGLFPPPDDLTGLCLCRAARLPSSHWPRTLWLHWWRQSDCGPAPDCRPGRLQRRNRFHASNGH